ncbi:hypothetical protein LguiB_022159 [Lonicera macranthoides]
MHDIYIYTVHPLLFICFELDFVFSNLGFIASLLHPSSTKTGGLHLSWFGCQLSKIIQPSDQHGWFRPLELLTVWLTKPNREP